MSSAPFSPAEVLAFWREAGPRRWFSKDEAFDADFRKQFIGAHFAAAARQLDDWAADAEGALALVLLLDQFPRNAFRGTAHSFATDPLARFVAGQAIEAGHDRRVEADLRSFFYLPFEHSEDPADQQRAVDLHLPLGPEVARWALLHQDIIQRFGRFPHRNAALGRRTTPEEQAFLDEGGFSG